MYLYGGRLSDEDGENDPNFPALNDLFVINVTKLVVSGWLGGFCFVLCFCVVACCGWGDCPMSMVWWVRSLVCFYECSAQHGFMGVASSRGQRPSGASLGCLGCVWNLGLEKTLRTNRKKCGGSG